MDDNPSPSFVRAIRTINAIERALHHDGDDAPTRRARVRDVLRKAGCGEPDSSRLAGLFVPDEDGGADDDRG